MRVHDPNLKIVKQALAVGLVVMLSASSGCTRSKVIDSFPEEYVGIGVELTMQDGLPVITRILADSPAHQAGLMIGDKIITIDEMQLADWCLGEQIEHVRARPAEADNGNLIHRQLVREAADPSPCRSCVMVVEHWIGFIGVCHHVSARIS